MRARWVPWEPEGMCVALYPMEYDALRVEAAVLWIEKGGQKAEVENGGEKRCGIFKSLCAILVPVREGLIFCFLLLLFFDQNRLEVVQPRRKSASFLGLEWPTIRKSEWMRLP
jgi:hypothetical protein